MASSTSRANVVWGRQLLQVHGLADGWSYGHNYLDEQHCSLHQPQTYSGSGRFVREAGTSLVLGKKRAREFWPYVRDTEVVKPKIALVVPTASMLNEYPYQALSQSYPLYLRAFVRWSQMLDHRDLDFRHVPEGAILAGDGESATSIGSAHSPATVQCRVLGFRVTRYQRHHAVDIVVGLLPYGSAC